MDVFLIAVSGLAPPLATPVRTAWFTPWSHKKKFEVGALQPKKKKKKKKIHDLRGPMTLSGCGDFVSLGVQLCIVKWH